MTPDQAAWVRDNAWLPAMRRRSFDQPHPWEWTICACQMRECVACQSGLHDRCQLLRGGPVTFDEGHVMVPRGDWLLPATFPQPCRHPRRDDHMWRRPTIVALLWLADRTCTWACTCSCTSGTDDAAAFVQLDLFAEVA